jgi:1-acyl-sn-glycerol-3-phosphate acyltransferase
MDETQWHYEPAQDLDQSLIQRLRHFPREPDMLVYGLRSLAALVLRGWLRVYHRLRIEGLENLPADGSFIMVCNHTSHQDALCLLSAIPLRKLHRAFPAAAQDYFFVNVRRMAVAAILANALPFSRDAHPRQSLAICRRLLGNPGNILILFPEGTRSVDGELGEFRPGIGALAAGSGAPVVPCALQGAFAAWPKGALLPRPRRLRLIIGVSRCYTESKTNRTSVHRITEELHEAVRQLLVS